MWERAAFLSFYASLCIAQRVAIANLGERQLNSSSQNSFSSTVGATRLPASSSQTSQSLLPASSSLTTRQAAATSVTVSNTATASNPTVVVVGLSSSAASQLGSSVQSFDPSGTTTITFTPTANTASFEVTSVSENFNTATAIPISFPSNGVPQVPSSLVSEISQAEQSLNTPTNAAQVISSKLESIDSSQASQASQASAGVSQMSVSLPAQDTATGSVFFSIPIPTIETAASSNPVSNGATTFPLPFPGTISSIPTASSVPSTVASTTSPSSILSTSTSSSVISSTTSSSSDTSSSSTSSSSSSSMSQSNSSATTLPGNSMKRTSPLSAGAIAGIVVGVAAALLIFGALLLWLLRRRSHQPVPQSPRVYPEEAYLYDPPIDPPPRAMSPARPGANSLAASPGFPPPEMSQAQAEREGLLGVGAGAAAGLGAAGVARHRRNMASDGREYGGAGRPVDPFADPPTQAEQERWPLDPEGHNGTLHPEDIDPGLGYLSGSSAGPSTREGPGPSREGGNGIGTAVSPSAYEGDEGGEAAASGVGGLGGRSVGPHNHDIPGRYGPGGIMRGGNTGKLRTSGLSPTAGPSSAGAGVSPVLREARRAWGWES